MRDKWRRQQIELWVDEKIPEDKEVLIFTGHWVEDNIVFVIYEEG